MRKKYKDEKHCRRVIQEYFNKNNSKKKISNVQRVPLSKFGSNITRKLSKEEVKSLVQPERKSEIKVYELNLSENSEKLKENSEKPKIIVVGKKYKNFSSEHSNLFPMFVEEESLRLCNEVYRNGSTLSHLFPKVYSCIREFKRSRTRSSLMV